MKLIAINLLRGGVFSLAVVAAFAFTTPQPQSASYFTFDGENWMDITEVYESGNYSCQPDVDKICVADENLQPLSPSNVDRRIQTTP